MTAVGQWAVSITVLWTLAGCDALDRGRLASLPPFPDPDSGQIIPPFDSGTVMDSGPPMDSGSPMDSGPPMDGSGLGDAQSDASDDAESDAAMICGEDDFDCCPADSTKLAPGVCGCGVPDDDGDGDDTADCIDLCPSDANKTAPGECGCGSAETSAADCSALHSALLHRYRFEGTGTAVVDDISGANGTVVNAALNDSSTLTLAGGTTNQYVDLPDGIISALTDATFEVWLNWQGGGGWQRIFDFGDMNGTNGDTYVFVTPQRAGSPNALRATMSLAGSASEVVINGTAALGTGALHHVALVVDHQTELRLYLDGVLVSSAANTRALASLNDVNNWLGRSQYSVDPSLGGTYHEFRIYDAALSATQVATSFAFGPDPAFLE